MSARYSRSAPSGRRMIMSGSQPDERRELIQTTLNAMQVTTDLKVGSMRVEVWVASPEPAVGVFTTARNLSRAPAASLVIGSAAPWMTEPACRQVRQLSGSGEGPGEDGARSQRRGNLGDEERTSS
jgi:hypothetical protein